MENKHIELSADEVSALVECVRGTVREIAANLDSEIAEDREDASAHHVFVDCMDERIRTYRTLASVVDKLYDYWLPDEIKKLIMRCIAAKHSEVPE